VARFEGDKRIDVFLVHCPNYECVYNRKGKCRWGISFKMAECGEYRTEEAESDG